MRPRALALFLPLFAVLALAAAGQEAARPGPVRPGPTRPGLARPGLERPATIDEFLRLGERTRVIAHRGFSGLLAE